MTIALEVLDDLDAAVLRLDEANTPALQRRALREELAHLYTLQELARTATRTRAGARWTPLAMQGRSRRA